MTDPNIPNPEEMLDMVKLSERFTTGDDTVARLYQFRTIIDTDGETKVECSTYGSFPDVYEGLTQFASDTDDKCVGLAVAVCGWASPCDRDENGKPVTEASLPPSQSPDRRRVSLLYVVGVDNRHANLLIFTDTGETDRESDGQGELSDAVRTALHFHRFDNEEIRRAWDRAEEELRRIVGEIG